MTLVEKNFFFFDLHEFWSEIRRTGEILQLAFDAFVNEFRIDRLTVDKLVEEIKKGEFSQINRFTLFMDSSAAKATSLVFEYNALKNIIQWRRIFRIFWYLV